MAQLLPGLCRRQLTVENRMDSDTESTPIIRGYGAVFYNASDPGTEYWLWSDTVERIMPGAFDRALQEKDDARSFFNHDANLILGRTKSETLDLSVDATGLRYEVTPPDSAAAGHVVAAIGRGDVDGSSFMFEVERATWVEEESNNDNGTLWIRQIEAVKLWEVGPVVFPAYESSTSELRELRSRLAADPLHRRYTDWLDRHVSAAREDFARSTLNSSEARSQRAAAMESRVSELRL